MKYLVVGLGNFGCTLACSLTDMGHDVIGVDYKEHLVEEIKDKISVAYIMDATEKVALQTLPLDDLDCAVVAIGQSMDHSLRVVAALKELKVPHIYARAIDPTHLSILDAMNIQKVFIPERLAAESIAEKLVADDFESIA